MQATAYPASGSAALALDRCPAVAVDGPEPPARLGAQQLELLREPCAKIIPFESFAAHRIQPVFRIALSAAAPAAAPARQPAAAPKEPPRSRQAAATPRDERQSRLDFYVPPPQGPRTLKTQAEAVVYCDAEAAAPKRRAIAAAIDGGMIATGYCAFLFAFHLMGGMFRINHQTMPLFAAGFGALAIFYGMIWIWAGRETAGMKWTGLRLINFDGFPADRRARIVRALSACMSCCSAGVGLLWALVDEERLTWHDHISKTFPTVEEPNRTFRKR